MHSDKQVGTYMYHVHGVGDEVSIAAYMMISVWSRISSYTSAIIYWTHADPHHHDHLGGYHIKGGDALSYKFSVVAMLFKVKPNNIRSELI